MCPTMIPSEGVPSPSDSTWSALNDLEISLPVDDGQSSYDSSDKYFLVYAETLIPGRGDPIHDGAVVVKNGKFTHVGKRESVNAQLIEEHGHPVARQMIIDAPQVKTLMPGLWGSYPFPLLLRPLIFP